MKILFLSTLNFSLSLTSAFQSITKWNNSKIFITSLREEFYQNIGSIKKEEERKDM
jgi:hypothetical protein